MLSSKHCYVNVQWIFNQISVAGIVKKQQKQTVELIWRANVISSLFPIHESVSPKPLSIPLELFRFFFLIGKIYAAQGAVTVKLTLVANEKKL